MIERYYSTPKTKHLPIKNQWVSIESVSPYAISALIAAEDNLFPTHWGFDFKQINEARDESLKGIRKRGASTISMQVSKNVFLWHGRTWTRKALEAGFTLIIETLWSKERIMEVYLNVAELGPAMYGIEAASLEYFKKSSGQLTMEESAMMATALPNPLVRKPSKPSNYMQIYQQNILSNMHLLGKIDLSKKQKTKKPLKK